MSKRLQQILLISIPFLTLSCTSVEKLAERGKFERLVWFDPESKEILRFHDGYAQVTRWDTTREHRHEIDQFFTYRYDSATRRITYNDKTVSITQHGALEWRLEKYKPQELFREGATTSPKPMEESIAQPVEDATKKIQVFGSVKSTNESDVLHAQMRFRAVADSAHSRAALTDSIGNFSVTLHREAYQVTAEAAGYLSESQYIDLSKINPNSPLVRLGRKPLRLVPIEEGEVLSFGITFPFKASALQPAVMPELMRLAQTLKNYPGLVVEVRGHTDNTGTTAANITLSTLRANQVRDFLITKGIAKTRLSAKGYGPTIPLVSNDEEEEGRALNRRVDIKVIRFSQPPL